MYDLLIRGGTVVDGSGDSAVPADVAILDGKIAAVAPRIESGAARVIDAAGRLVTRGLSIFTAMPMCGCSPRTLEKLNCIRA